MGYDVASILFLNKNRDLFAGKTILTLGTLYPFLHEKDYTRLRHYDARLGRLQLHPRESFSQALFVDVFNAASLVTLDISNYQGATIIQNLNSDLSVANRSICDVVIDLGTLEHCSRVDKALSNIFALLRDSGIYIFALPANNWLDHGFFQFSPTFFKDLCRENSSLKLIDIRYSIQGRLHDLPSGPFTSICLRCPGGHRVGLVGIVQKRTMSNFSMNFIQSRYLHEFSAQGRILADSLFSERNAFATYLRYPKILMFRLISFALSSALIPFTVRLAFASALDSLRAKCLSLTRPQHF